MRRFLVLILFATLFYCGKTKRKTSKVELKMPGVHPEKEDSYVCTSLKLPPGVSYIVEYEPHAHKETVHHMLLFGCDEPGLYQKSWNCGDMGSRICAGSESILFAWARDAPPPHLPKGVGFKVGGNTEIKYLVLQLHYVHPLKDGHYDSSGLTLSLTPIRQPNVASIYLLMANYARIPPHARGFHVDIGCKYDSDQEIHAFAFRTHAHDLGRVITGYRIRDKSWKLLGKGDPHAPQAFYPMKNITTIQKGDILAARCTYDTYNTQRTGVTTMGASAKDEMCNFYMMYYRSSNSDKETPELCSDQFTYKKLFRSFPKDSDVALKSSSVHHHHHHHGQHVASNEQQEHKPGASQGTGVVSGSKIESVSDATSTESSEFQEISTVSSYSENPKQDVHHLLKNVPHASAHTNAVTDVSTAMTTSTSVSEQTTHTLGSTAAPTTGHKLVGEHNDTGHTDTGMGSLNTKKHLEAHITNQNSTPSTTRRVSGKGHGVSGTSLQKGSTNRVEKLLVVESWPTHVTKELGQVTGLGLDSAGQLFVFHRAERIWDFDTFDEEDKFRHPKTQGTIRGPTILILDSKTGKILEKLGQKMFYLPHGLTIDHEDNLWVTDVGRHQVMKFKRGEFHKPSLVLGENLVPGSDENHFCKPTDVAVEKSGVFYVADGYCNGRIMKFSPKGKLLKTWGKQSATENPAPSTFLIPHSLALDEKNAMLYAADRENGRIQCFDRAGKFHGEITSPLFGGRVFAVDFNNQDDVLYAVNGPGKTKIQGFTINASSGKIIASWSPHDKGFSQPHAVVSNGSEVYVAEIGPNRVWKMEAEQRSQVVPPKESNFGRGINDAAILNKPTQAPVNGNTDSNNGSSKEASRSNKPAVVILTILSIPVVVLLLVGLISKVRGRKKLPKYDMMDEALGNHTAQGKWCASMNCCTKSYHNMEELYLMDSDSDLEIFPDVHVNKK